MYLLYFSNAVVMDVEVRSNCLHTVVDSRRICRRPYGYSYT